MKKRIMFGLTLLSVTYLHTADQQPTLTVKLPPTARAKFANPEYLAGFKQRTEQRKLEEAALKAAEKEQYIQTTATFLNILLEDISKHNKTDVLPPNLPLDYYRYDDGTLYPKINTELLRKLNPIELENFVSNIIHTHNEVFKSLQKTHTVKWADDANQALEDLCPTDTFPPEAQFEMHGYPIRFGARRKSNSTARATEGKFWYETLSPEQQDFYQKKEMDNRNSTQPNDPEEQKTLNQMKAENIIIDRRWKNNVGSRIEQLRRMHPELFNK